MSRAGFHNLNGPIAGFADCAMPVLRAFALKGDPRNSFDAAGVDAGMFTKGLSTQTANSLQLHGINPTTLSLLCQTKSRLTNNFY